MIENFVNIEFIKVTNNTPPNVHCLICLSPL